MIFKIRVNKQRPEEEREEREVLGSDDDVLCSLSIVCSIFDTLNIPNILVLPFAFLRMRKQIIKLFIVWWKTRVNVWNGYAALLALSNALISCKQFPRDGSFKGWSLRISSDARDESL